MQLLETSWATSPSPTNLVQVKAELKDPETTRKAIKELSQYGVVDEETIQLILGLLSEGDLLIQRDVIEALGKLRVDSEGAISVLCNLLPLDCGEEAADALRKIGNKSKQVVSALDRELERSNPKAIIHAMWALGERTEKVIHAITKLDAEDLLEVVQECEVKDKKVAQVFLNAMQQNPYLV